LEIIISSLEVKSTKIHIKSKSNTVRNTFTSNMIKHRNVSALIAAAAFGSTALFGCSSKDDPESVADDQLKLMGTYTEKFSKAAEQAKKDGNAKACQAVLDEFTKAAEKLQEKMDKAFEKLSEEDQEKQEKELQSKMGSKIREKQSAMDTARKQCFKMGNAEDPEDDEASGSRAKQIANGFFTELAKVYEKAVQNLSKKSAVEVDRELQSTIMSDDFLGLGKNGKMQKNLKEIGVSVDDIDIDEIIQMFEEMADDETVQAFEQAKQQYYNAAKAKATAKPAKVVVASVTQNVPGVGRVTVTQSGVVAPSTRGRGPRHGGNLTTEPPASPPPFSKLAPPKQTAMVNDAAEQINQYTRQIKALDGKPKQQQEAALKQILKDTEPMFTTGFGFIETEADMAAYQGQPKFAKDKIEQAQQQMREAIADLVKQVVPFTAQEKAAIKEFWQKLTEQNVQKSQEMTESAVEKYGKVKPGPEADATCKSIEQKVAKDLHAFQEKSLKDYADLVDSQSTGEEPSKWPYFVRLSEAEQAKILFGSSGEGQMSELQQGLFSLAKENQAAIEDARRKCGVAGEDSGEEDETFEGEAVDEELSQQQVGALEVFLKDAAKVAAATDLMPKVMAEDEKFLAALQAPSLTAQQFAQQANQHSKGVETHVNPTSLKDQAADPALKALDVLMAFDDEEAIPETLQSLLSDAKNEAFLEALGAYSTKRKELMQAVAAKSKGLLSENWPTYFGGLDKAAVGQLLLDSSPPARSSEGSKPKIANTSAGDLAGNGNRKPTRTPRAGERMQSA